MNWNQEIELLYANETIVQIVVILVSLFKSVCKYTINGDEDVFNPNCWNSWRVST